MKKELQSQVYLKRNGKEWSPFFDLSQEEQKKNIEKWCLSNTEILLDHIGWERIKEQK